MLYCRCRWLGHSSSKAWISINPTTLLSSRDLKYPRISIKRCPFCVCGTCFSKPFPPAMRLSIFDHWLWGPHQHSNSPQSLKGWDELSNIKFLNIIQEVFVASFSQLIHQFALSIFILSCWTSRHISISVDGDRIAEPVTLGISRDICRVSAKELHVSHNSSRLRSSPLILLTGALYCSLKQTLF